MFGFSRSYVLGKGLEENFRRAMTISRGDITVFVTKPISAIFLSLCLLLIVSQIYVAFRKKPALLVGLPAAAE